MEKRWVVVKKNKQMKMERREERSASEMKLQRQQREHLEEKPTPEKEPIFNGGDGVDLCEVWFPFSRELRLGIFSVLG